MTIHRKGRIIAYRAPEPENPFRSHDAGQSAVTPEIRLSINTTALTESLAKLRGD